MLPSKSHKVFLIESVSVLFLNLSFNFKASFLLQCSTSMATECLWRIPFVESTKTKALCIGFIRQSNSNLLKDDKIVNTTMIYLDGEINLLNRMKQAKFGQGFKSPIFTAHSFKWMMELIPNIAPGSHVTKCVLTVLSLGCNPIFNDITASCLLSISFKDGKVYDHASKTCSKSKPSIIFQIEKLHDYLKNTDHIDVKIMISVSTGVVDIPINIPRLIPITGSFEWRGKNIVQLHAKGIKTNLVNMHGITWSVSVSDIGCILWGLGIPSNIDALLIHCIIEMNGRILVSKCKYLQHPGPNRLFMDENHVITSSGFNIDDINIRLTIQLLGIYDIDGNFLMNDCYFKNMWKQVTPQKSIGYLWKTPKLNATETELVCYGYIRKAFSYYIPDSLLKLCLLFCDYSYTLKEIQYGKHDDEFFSDIFDVDGFKFRLELLCGDSGNNDDKDYYIFLRLMSFCPNISMIHVYGKLFILELNASITANCISFHPGHRSIEFDTNFSFTWNKIKHLKKLSFKVDISTLNVEDKDQTVMQDWSKYISNYPCNKFDSYRWKISNKDIMTKIKTAPNCIGFFNDLFELFGIKMLVEIVPNGDTKDDIGDCVLYIWIASFPVNLSAISVFAILTCHETNTKYRGSFQFDKESSVIRWDPDTLKFEDIMNVDQLTFKVEMILIDIFDKNGYCMTNEWIQSWRSRPKLNELSMIELGEYEWKVDKLIMDEMQNAPNGKAFNSPIFKIGPIQWMFEVLFLSFIHLFPASNYILLMIGLSKWCVKRR